MSSICPFVSYEMEIYKEIFNAVEGGRYLAGSVSLVSAFSSGHDPRVLGSSHTSGSLLGGEPASPSESACPSPCLCSLCQINKENL